LRWVLVLVWSWCWHPDASTASPSPSPSSSVHPEQQVPSSFAPASLGPQDSRSPLSHASLVVAEHARNARVHRDVSCPAGCAWAGVQVWVGSCAMQAPPHLCCFVPLVRCQGGELGKPGWEMGERQVGFFRPSKSRHCADTACYQTVRLLSGPCSLPTLATDQPHPAHHRRRWAARDGQVLEVLDSSAASSTFKVSIQHNMSMGGGGR